MASRKSAKADRPRKSANAPSARRAKRTDTSRSRTAQTLPLIVGIGASAGGLEAFTRLIQHLPSDTGMAFVLVQHLDPDHKSALSELLSRATSLPVREATNDLPVEPDHVYVIPPNRNMSIADAVLRLGPRRVTDGSHRSIDFFLQSLAQDQRERAIGVILSGTGSDGTVGLEAIKAEGGITFAQDDSAQYDSMPRSAVAAGCVDFVLKPEDIATELVGIASHPLVNGRSSARSTRAEDDRADATAHEDDAAALPSGGRGAPRTGARKARAESDGASGKGGDDGYKKILLVLRNHCGVDFSLYKSATIQRRINRRMVLNRVNSLEEYARFLRGNRAELDALYSDVLISVTSFFRNPDAFDALRREVFPKLLSQRDDGPLRVWVLGCSTGQETYSIAMTYAEVAEQTPRARQLQVFATDLNEALLDKARQGLYAKSLVQDVSPDRLRRFFVEEDGGYRISKQLREMVVFARQNLISDPPFSRMDLVSCRNLLIYLEPSLQEKFLPSLHYALRPEGFLFLGASESIGRFADLFEAVDRKHKIFARKAGPTPAFQLPARKEPGERAMQERGGASAPPASREPEPEDFRGELNAPREADRVTINRYAPPGVLVDADLHILQFRGPTGAYLEPPTGKASFDLFKMAREGLMLPLRAAINKANKDNKAVRREGIQFKENGKSRTVNLEVVPLKNLRERCLLILFEDAGRGAGRVRSSGAREGGAAQQPVPVSRQDTRRAADAERELSEMRDYLQSVQEQHEATNEELQASNEEVQSANEELQSINEELETSKEELESANEELTTVNEEMANRNAELNRLNSDLVNLQSSLRIPILLLGRDLTIRRFSPQAEKRFNLGAGDVGRPVGSIAHHLDLTDLDGLVGEVIDTVQEREREVRDRDGRWYSLRACPYMTLDNKIDGAVLVLVDIDALKRTEQEMKAARDYNEAVVRTVPDPLIVLDADLRFDSANDAFHRTFELTPAETEGRSIFALDDGAWEIPRLRELLEDILPHNSSFEDLEVTHEFKRIGRRTVLVNARTLQQLEDKGKLVLMGFRDITEVLAYQTELRRSEARKDAMLMTALDGIVAMDHEGRCVEFSPAAEAMFGYPRADVLGEPLADFIIPERLREKHRRGLARYVSTGKGRVLNHRIEMPALRADGTEFPVELAIAPVPDSDPPLFTGFVRDISARKQAEETLRLSETKYRTIFEGAGVSLWEEDFSAVKAAIDDLRSEGVEDFRRYFEEHPEFVQKAIGLVRVLDVNDASVSLFEARDKSELLGPLPDIFVPETLPIFVEELVTVAEGRTSMSSEARLNTVRGNPIYVLFTMVLPPPTEQPDRVLFSILDISDRRKAEQDLRSQAEELARFNRVAVGRETRMIELKKEINELRGQGGEPARYPLEFERQGDDSDG